MPLRSDGDKVTITLVITKEQDRRLRERWQRQRENRPLEEVRLSDIGREVIEAGLHIISFTPTSSLLASSTVASREGGVA